MAKIIMDENFFGEAKAFIRQNNRVAIGEGTPDDVILEVVKGCIQYAAHKLGETKSKNEETTLELPELITFKCNYRESSGEEDGSFNAAVVLGSEFKKRLKDDELLESDDDDDDEDEE